MSRSCFNCYMFPNCPILKSMGTEEFDSMDELFILEYGKYCTDYQCLGH